MENIPLHNQEGKETIFVNDLRTIVSAARDASYRMANLMQVAQNWLIGRRIVEQEQQGKIRAEYGKHVVELASQVLTKEFGQGSSETQIRNFRKFYLTFSGLRIQQTVPAEFRSRLASIQQTMPAESSDKTTKVSYEDVGQMDMYLKLFDTYKRPEGDNPTIGIILCSETNADVARFSTLATNKQMYASKYLTYMPSKEVLAREIEQQKEIFRLRNNNEEEV